MGKFRRMKDLLEVFGGATDLYLRRLIQAYHKKSDSGEKLKEAILSGNEGDMHREWVNWISC